MARLKVNQLKKVICSVCKGNGEARNTELLKDQTSK